MSPSCCGIRGLRRIRIGNVEVGLTGFDTVMEALLMEGYSPEDNHLGRTFVQRLRESGNYIPPDQESLYVPVVTELFRKFYRGKASSSADKNWRSGP